MTEIADALFTRTQQQVLGLLYSKPDRSYYTNEILRLTGMGVATVKRELDRMVAAGILTLRRQGNQRHYQASPKCPVYPELLGIVRKSLGVVDVLRGALEPLAEQIETAFVFGSIARGKESPFSDIDLMVVGEVGFSDITAALYPAQQSLSRDINPRIYRGAEWREILEQPNAFVRDILSNPRLNILDH